MISRHVKSLLPVLLGLCVCAPSFAQQHGRTPRFGDFGTVTPPQVVPNTAQSGKYPTLAARRHEEGSVKLALAVAPDGTLRHADVVKSSGSSSLDAGAILAVYDWRFLPAQNHGFNVEGHTEITFDFHIEDADGSETEYPVPPLPPHDQFRWPAICRGWASHRRFAPPPILARPTGPASRAMSSLN